MSWRTSAAGDLLWSGLAGLVRGLFFFHPLVWLAHREALLAREAACDALALRASGIRPSEYGRSSWTSPPGARSGPPLGGRRPLAWPVRPAPYEAEAAELEAGSKGFPVSHAARKAAEAAVREAEALRDVLRAETQTAPDAGTLNRRPGPPGSSK